MPVIQHIGSDKVFDFDKCYDPSTESYVIPKEYITKGVRKNIEQVVENVETSKRKSIFSIAETHEGSFRYIEEKWGKDRTVRVPLDDVITYSLSVAKYKQWTANNCQFIENIHRQGWISLKQYIVIREIVLRQTKNASWESDDDTELSLGYYGLQGT